MRINKYIAACGVCSRRGADELVAQGKVCINGRVAQSGDQVEETDHVSVDGTLISLPEDHVILAYNKPVGVVCTANDPHAKRCVLQEVNYPARLTYAGRLDKDSEGLLLLTDDGDLIDAMMRGRNDHEKEYIVTLDKPIREEDLVIFRKGIYLTELRVKTKPCEVEKIEENVIKMVLTQGLNRQIRRMCAERGYKVRKLQRTRVMNVFLASLKPGEWREIDAKERMELYRLCGMKNK